MSWLSDTFSSVGDWFGDIDFGLGDIDLGLGDLWDAVPESEDVGFDLWDSDLWSRGKGDDKESYWSGFLGDVFSPQAILGGALAIGKNYANRGAAEDALEQQLAMKQEERAWLEAQQQQKMEFEREMIMAKIAAEKEALAEKLAYKKKAEQYVQRLAAKTNQAGAATTGANLTSQAYSNLANSAQPGGGR